MLPVDRLHGDWSHPCPVWNRRPKAGIFVSRVQSPRRLRHRPVDFRLSISSFNSVLHIEYFGVNHWRILKINNRSTNGPKAKGSFFSFSVYDIKSRYFHWSFDEYIIAVISTGFYRFCDVWKKKNGEESKNHLFAWRRPDAAIRRYRGERTVARIKIGGVHFTRQNFRVVRRGHEIKKQQTHRF